MMRSPLLGRRRDWRRYPRGLNRCAAALTAGVLGMGPVAALDLALPPGAELVFDQGASFGQHLIARGPWASNALRAIPVEGAVQQLIWQVRDADTTALGVFTVLRDQLTAQGFELIFTCADRTCGGFDFRHALPLGQPPQMHIDLGNFHYFAGQAASDEGPRHVALTVSQGGAVSFVHLALVEPPNTQAPPVTPSSRSPEAPEPAASAVVEADGDLITQLVALGAAPLDDLQFDPGASNLSGAEYGSLRQLADYLNDNPGQTIALVGHTDALGSLEGNIALSQARAAAVRRHLVDRLGADPGQIEAHGIGFLAPRASNRSANGRDRNRRVEVVLLTQG